MRRAAPFLLWASVASAQAPDAATRNTAREIADRAAEHYDRGEWGPALELFQRAYALVPAPTIAVFEARCLAQLGRLVEADEAYARAETSPVDRDPNGFLRRAVREAEAEGGALRQRIPRLRVQVEGVAASAPTLRVVLDGQALNPALLGLERPLDPGTHRVEAHYEGSLREGQDVALREGERRTVLLRVRPAPRPGAAPSPSRPAPPAPARGATQRTIGLVALGAGGVALGVGAVTGALMLGKQSDLEGACPGRECPPEQHGELDSYRTLRTVSTIGYGVGLVSAGLGAALFVTAPSAPRAASLRPWVGLGAAGVAGAF